MNLRIKTLAIVGGTVAGLLGVVYFATRPVVLRQFSQVEQQNAVEQVRRADQMLNIYLEDSAEKSQSVASWKGTYEYAQDHNSEYRDYYLSVGALKAMGVELAVVVDKQNRIIFDGQISTRGQIVPISAELKSQLKPGSKALIHSGLIDPKGFFWTEGSTLWALGALPITNDTATAPSNGTLIFGRRILPEELDRRLQTLGVPASIIPIEQLPPASSDLPPPQQ